MKQNLIIFTQSRIERQIDTVTLKNSKKDAAHLYQKSEFSELKKVGA